MVVLAVKIKRINFDLPLYRLPANQVASPIFFVTENEKAYLSWVEYVDDSTDVLMCSILEDKQWSTPNKVAQGNDWFTNWADFPALVAYKGDAKSLAAHWLAKSGSGTYDYDVTISQSNDGGKNWTKPFIPHTDAIAAEHGFVSMLPLNEDRIFITWLDGRNTKTKDSETHKTLHHGHGQGGAMTIRAAVFDKKGNLYEEVELDHRVCDCCQTSAAMTSEGLIVAYRDRLEEEIRDISYVRQVNGQWTQPQRIHKDNWKIAGCPVNGPKVAANGKKVAIVWFTMESEQPLIKIAFSEDAGANFGNPIWVNDGQALGRVDVVLLDNGTAIVSWLKKNEKEASIRLAEVTKSGIIGTRHHLIPTDASRLSGFPIMEKLGKRLLLAWTTVEKGNTKVQTAFIDY